MSSPQRRRLVRAAAALLALILLPLTAITGSAATATFTKPLNSSGPDPWMTYHDGYYRLRIDTISTDQGRADATFRFAG